MAASSRTLALINMLRVQGCLLCMITIFYHHEQELLMFLFLIIETFVVKALLVPSFLKNVALKNNIKRDSDPRFPHFYLLVVSSFIFLGGLLVSNIHSEYLTNVSTLYFGIALSTIIISFFFMITKKKLITHVIGFAMLENGIFLFSFSVAKEMPMIVSLGVLLDVFIAIFTLGLLLGKLEKGFHNPDVCQICNLKDCDCDE
jgi:hydrogenase-4 component E